MLDIIRVAVIDDHPMFRDGVVQTLGRGAPISVVAEGASATEALRIAHELRPDILLVDLDMPGGGMKAAAEVIKICSRIKIVILTASQDEDHVLEALDLGAKGYVLKGTGGVELTRILMSVAAGQTYVAPELAAKCFRSSRTFEARSRDPNPLSRREDQVLDSVALGMTNKEIARHLDVSEKTVKHHMTSIMDKLRVRNRVEVALTARKRSPPQEK